MRVTKLNIRYSEILASVLVLALCGLACGYEVSWILGQSSPPVWSITPPSPTTSDVIHFSGPTEVFGNSCAAEMNVGGTATLSIDQANKTIELWFKGPPPIVCPLIWDPVCGLEGSFGPLEAGQWRFFCQHPDASFSISFTVGAMGAGFTYQAQLIEDNAVAEGLYDLEFKLFDDPETGTEQGSTNMLEDVDVIDGYFTVVLDFGSNVFDGDPRWLEIGVRPGDSTDGFTILSPRQQIAPTPYAIYALTAGEDGDWMTNGDDMYSIPPGNVGIGTTSPGAKLEVNGQIKITDGSQGTGKVLTCDASGLSSWQTPAAAGGDITSVTAGTGLNGGGTSGAVTLNVDVPLELSGSVASPGAIIIGNNSINGPGVYGSSSGLGGFGVMGKHVISGNYGSLGSIYGVYGRSDSGFAGKFRGKVDITGNLTIGGSLSKGSGSFKIDHPLDPENKFLQHSFVESPDMMNIYNGNVTLDENGQAVVELPDYFEALNYNFRYQLTCIGGFAQVYIAEEISNNRFKIAGGTKGMKVSWQVTGIRQDLYAVANRIQVEEDKPVDERGYYLHPKAYGFSEDKGIERLHNPAPIEQAKGQECEVDHEAS